MGWDDIDLSKLLSGMVTFKDTSEVVFVDFLNTFARAIAEKDQITMPELVTGEGVPIELITFSGAPVGSQAFKDNYRLMLTRLKAKVTNPWTKSGSGSGSWYLETVLTDINNASLHIVSQDDFRTAMGENAYDLLFSVNNLDSIAFDKLWTAEILQSIKPALELMQVFTPLIVSSVSTGNPIGDLLLNQYDLVDGDISTSVRLRRLNTLGDVGGTFDQAVAGNTNPYTSESIDLGIPTVYLNDQEITHSANTNKWTIGIQTFFDVTRIRYKTQDLNGSTIDMEVVPVAEIDNNYRRPEAGKYRRILANQPVHPDYPIIQFPNKLLVQTPVDSFTFTPSQGNEKLLSFFGGVPFDPFTPLNGEDLSLGSYVEDQLFQAGDETAYVNTNNPALEFFIA